MTIVIIIGRLNGTNRQTKKQTNHKPQLSPSLSVFFSPNQIIFLFPKSTKIKLSTQTNGYLISSLGV
jgi:hypothetical protein